MTVAYLRLLQQSYFLILQIFLGIHRNRHGCHECLRYKLGKVPRFHLQYKKIEYLAQSNNRIRKRHLTGHLNNNLEFQDKIQEFVLLFQVHVQYNEVYQSMYHQAEKEMKFKRMITLKYINTSH